MCEKLDEIKAERVEAGSCDSPVPEKSSNEEGIAEEAPGCPPSDERVIQRVDALLDDVTARIAMLEELFRTKIDRTEYEVETLRKQSEEIQEYRTDLYAKLTHPLLREVARIRAGMMQALKSVDAEGLVCASVIEAYADDLADVLLDYGIEDYVPEPGDKFVSGICKIAGKQETDDLALVGTIVETKAQGYRMQSGEPFVPARVKVYTRKGA